MKRVIENDAHDSDDYSNTNRECDHHPQYKGINNTSTNHRCLASNGNECWLCDSGCKTNNKRKYNDPKSSRETGELL